LPRFHDFSFVDFLYEVDRIYGIALFFEFLDERKKTGAIQEAE